MTTDLSLIRETSVSCYFQRISNTINRIITPWGGLNFVCVHNFICGMQSIEFSVPEFNENSTISSNAVCQRHTNFSCSEWKQKLVKATSLVRIDWIYSKTYKMNSHIFCYSCFRWHIRLAASLFTQLVYTKMESVKNTIRR